MNEALVFCQFLLISKNSSEGLTVAVCVKTKIYNILSLHSLPFVLLNSSEFFGVITFQCTTQYITGSVVVYSDILLFCSTKSCRRCH